MLHGETMIFVVSARLFRRSRRSHTTPPALVPGAKRVRKPGKEPLLYWDEIARLWVRASSVRGKILRDNESLLQMRRENPENSLIESACRSILRTSRS